MSIMNKDKIPFTESDSYVDSVVNNATEQAIKVYRKRRQSQRKLSWIRPTLAVAASVVIVVGLGWRLIPMNEHTRDDAPTSTESPLDHFLSGISDEEAQQIVCYEIEEQPEY